MSAKSHCIASQRIPQCIPQPIPQRIASHKISHCIAFHIISYFIPLRSACLHVRILNSNLIGFLPSHVDSQCASHSASYHIISRCKLYRNASRFERGLYCIASQFRTRITHRALHHITQFHITHFLSSCVAFKCAPVNQFYLNLVFHSHAFTKVGFMYAPVNHPSMR
jgi:hypothetical protein